MKIEYYHSDASLHYQSYRKGVNDCPHCDFESWRSDDSTPDWLSESQVRAIVFIDGGTWYKKGQAVIVSECPKCFKNSFHHWSLETLLWDKFLNKEIIQKEIDRLAANAKAEWERSLCFRCAVEKEVKKDKFGHTLECLEDSGWYPKDPWETETFRCKKFAPVNSDTCVYCGKKVNNDEEVHSECQEKMDEIERISYNEWLRKMHNLGWHKDKKER